MRKLWLISLLFSLGCSFGFKVGPLPTTAPEPAASSTPTSTGAPSGRPVFASAYPSNLAGDVTGQPGANTVVNLTGSSGTVKVPSGTSLKLTQGGTVSSPNTETLWTLQPVDSTKAPFQLRLGAATFSGTVDEVQQLGYFGPSAGPEPTAYWGLEQDYNVDGTNHLMEMYWTFNGNPGNTNNERGLYVGWQRAGTTPGQLISYMAFGHGGDWSVEDAGNGYLKVLDATSTGLTFGETSYTIQGSGTLTINGSAIAGNSTLNLDADVLTFGDHSNTKWASFTLPATTGANWVAFNASNAATVGFVVSEDQAPTTAAGVPVALVGSAAGATAGVNVLGGNAVVAGGHTNSITGDGSHFLPAVVIGTNGINTTTFAPNVEMARFKQDGNGATYLDMSANGYVDEIKGSTLYLVGTSTIGAYVGATQVASLAAASGDYLYLGPSTSKLQITPTGVSVLGTGPSGGTAQSITIAPQAASATNGTPGSLVVNLGAPTGTGSHASFTVNDGGSSVFSSSNGFVWLNAPTPSITNWALYAIPANNQTFLNSTGTIYLEINNASYPFALNGSSLTLGVALELGSVGLGGVSGIGTGVLGIANATTPPTSNCTGGLCLWSDASDGLDERSSNSSVTTVAALPAGTHNTQTGKFGRYAAFLTDSTSGPTTIDTIAIPSGTVMGLEIHWQARQPSNINNGAGGEVVCECGNNAGTVACSGSGTSVWSGGTAFCGATGGTVPAITCVASGGSVLIKEACTGNSVATDYQIDVSTNND